MNRNIELAAKKLREAAAKGIPCTPIRSLIGTTSITKAYIVQEINTALRIAQGAKIVGSKIGLANAIIPILVFRPHILDPKLSFKLKL